MNQIRQKVRTKREGIGMASRRGEVLRCLMPHFSEKNLTTCFHELDEKKACGEDGVTKEEYGRDLKNNIQRLVKRLKSMSWRPGLSRQVLIPKAGGGSRPLAIANLEDKIVQAMFKKVLEAVYEPLFRDCSWGFRPSRGPHDAITRLNNTVWQGSCWHIIDVDIKNFFGEISHSKLLSLLKLRISDKRFLRYIARMLKAGILEETGEFFPESGTPQGSICSPVLSNIYAHYCIDIWFEDVVRPRLAGKGKLVRFADDFCICLSDRRDVDRVRPALQGRLHRFELRLNEEKTHVVTLDRNGVNKEKGKESGRNTIKFLGFELYMGKSRKGRILPRWKTAGDRLSRSLKSLYAWMKQSRNKYPLRELRDRYCSRMRGHINFFGISNNMRWLSRYCYAAKRTFFKWINRRSQKKSMNWEQFELYLKCFPLPGPVIKHRLF